MDVENEGHDFADLLTETRSKINRISDYIWATNHKIDECSFKYNGVMLKLMTARWALNLSGNGLAAENYKKARSHLETMTNNATAAITETHRVHLSFAPVQALLPPVRQNYKTVKSNHSEGAMQEFQAAVKSFNKSILDFNAADSTFNTETAGALDNIKTQLNSFFEECEKFNAVFSKDLEERRLLSLQQ